LIAATETLRALGANGLQRLRDGLQD